MIMYLLTGHSKREEPPHAEVDTTVLGLVARRVQPPVVGVRLGEPRHHHEHHHPQVQQREDVVKPRALTHSETAMGYNFKICT